LIPPLRGNKHDVDSSPLKVAILSRHELIRAGLTSLVRRFPERATVVDISRWDGHPSSAEVALYDLAALADHGTDDLRHLIASTPVVGLSRDSRDDLRDGARTVGVCEFVTEAVAAEELIATLERAANRSPTTSTTRDQGELTTREEAVLGLIGVGLSNKQIADELYLSINSIKTYVRSAYRKIGVKNRSQAVVYAVRHVSGGDSVADPYPDR
jgi:DNA-binding NarL/FixJ family response regulator